MVKEKVQPLAPKSTNSKRTLASPAPSAVVEASLSLTTRRHFSVTGALLHTAGSVLNAYTLLMICMITVLVSYSKVTLKRFCKSCDKVKRSPIGKKNS